MAKEIKVPDIGDFEKVDIIEVLVKPGDSIEPEQPLLTLESDKASMEIPAPEGGKVQEVKVKVGDKISQGDTILLLEAGEGAAGGAEPAAEPETQAQPAPTAGGGGAAGTQEQEVYCPDIGDFEKVDIIEVLVKPGDRLEPEQPMITLESDKASMEIPAPQAGTVKEVKVKVGDKIGQGDLILTMEGSGGAAAAPKAPAGAEKAAPPAPAAPAPAPAPSTGQAAPPGKAPPTGPAPQVDEAAFAKAHASPSVRRFARELGVDLGKVSGSGRKGRITQEDVQQYVKGVLSGQAAPAAAAPAAAPAGGAGIPPIPPQDFGKFGPVEDQPLSKIKRLTGANLHRSWLNVPMVTHNDEFDITATEDFRKSLKVEAEKQGVRVTMLAFLLKASAAALKQFPSFCSSLDPSGEKLILKKYYHIGVAVDTPDGLVVPVIRDVDQKSIYDLSREMGEISGKARNKKLKPAEMQGGCFTISSLGGIGGTSFTPLVNAPEVAILGVTRSSIKPVWDGKQFVPKMMLPLSLSYDHRVIDGAEAARFTA
ncbi:MAG: dihydrolipoyllysine-residue acetyltransferase, partial [Candidatus Competibacteraceae bacterium]|nr:dihydrolipoyllysine-residue acetyltransferase [Candidatus Competibacteraceae bacterium]